MLKLKHNTFDKKNYIIYFNEKNIVLMVKVE